MRINCNPQDQGLPQLPESPVLPVLFHELRAPEIQKAVQCQLKRKKNTLCDLRQKIQKKIDTLEVP